MKQEEKVISRPDSPMDGPMDGVRMTADCIRTDFIDNPKENEAMFTQRNKSEANISASVQLGTFSIRDKETNVMLTVAFGDAMAVMASAIDASKEVGSWKENEIATGDNVEFVEEP